jgi:hypothetical protein
VLVSAALLVQAAQKLVLLVILPNPRNLAVVMSKC